MGLFDFFKKNSAPAAASSAAPADKNVARLGRIVGDKLAQNYDRHDAIEALSRIESAESAAALLKRFTFSIEPSITDQEEKELAFHGVVSCGERAVEPVLAFCARAESLTWPLKILREILPGPRYAEELVDLLDNHDTDYSRNVEPKVQLLSALSGQRGDDVVEVLLRFLDDVSEPVRFQTILSLFSLEDPTLVPKVLDKIASEESVRLVTKVADCLSSRSWTVPDEYREPFGRALRASPARYNVTNSGQVQHY
ncbi:MAG: HEAT repeat domain-containing protein [Myxococcales bacterium]|nr:MAG: HEAT repeat domain-containing protein [Myxococcales bacterium]